MTDELKPCPFCGGEAGIWKAQQERPAWIACMGRCSVLVSKEYKTDGEAIAAWNTRAGLPATDAQALANPKVQALVEAAIEVWHDCIARSDRKGNVPIGATAFALLMDALEAIKEGQDNDR